MGCFRHLQLAVAILTLFTIVQAENRFVYNNEQLGIQTELPSRDWVLFDQSVGNIKVLIYSPEKSLEPRFAILLLPQNTMPGGMLGRSEEISRDAQGIYRQLSLRDSTLGDKTAEHLIYTLGESKIEEFGLSIDSYYMIVQVAAPFSIWKEEQQAKALRNIFQKFKWTGPIKYESKFDLSTPAEIKSKRARTIAPGYALASHDINVSVAIEKQQLSIEDTFVLEAKANLQKATLYFSLSDIEELACVDGNHRLAWRWEKSQRGTTGMLSLTMSPPMRKGESLTLKLKAKAHKEITWGETNQKTAFASHVFYYPVDHYNTADVKLTFDVPMGYQAISGGQLLEKRKRGDRTSFCYRGKFRTGRLLPMGFAVGKYTTLTKQTAQGLTIEAYALAPETKQAMQKHLQFLLQMANIFEDLMGPLPFSRAAFVQVDTGNSEIATSLPGLVLLSRDYWKDIGERKLDNIRFDDPTAANLFVFAREFSYQWSSYALPLSNELSEGISTFVNLLFIEKQTGREAYRQGVNFCKETYVTGIKGATDFAIANPEIYGSKAYSSIIRCKTSIILDMLRTLVGDDVFFTGWRAFFKSQVAENDGYQALQKVFQNAAKRDLNWFFEQWFFTSGYPHLLISWRQDQNGTYITVEQRQKGPLFRISGELELFFAENRVFSQTITIDQRKKTFIIVTAEPVVDIQFDSGEKILWELVER